MLNERYVLEHLIGRGGMAEVYQATDQVLGRTVAVKLLHEETADGLARARFTSEAQTLARLNHPGLVTVLDAGTAADRPYLVMELIDGQSLSECCDGTPLEAARVAEIGVQLAEALAYAHRCGVVHRDVKPGNVLLGSDGRARLTDFGIARLVSDTAQHTRAGDAIGSPAYLSPEQVQGAEVTLAADVYSLGLVLLEALTGLRAYPGSPTEAALARLSTPPPIPETVPVRWWPLLRVMTALRPADRPTAAQAAAALKQLSTATPQAAVVTPETHSDPAGCVVAPGPDSEAAGATSVLRLPVPPPKQTGADRGVLRTGGHRWLTFRVRRRWVVVVALAVLVLLLVVALGNRDHDRTPRVEPPRDVPPRLQQPLQDLHDAVNGSQQ